MQPGHSLFVVSKINDNWESLKGKFQNPKAIRHRVRVYLLYTVPSLLRQSTDNFKIWLNCRKDSDDEMKQYMEAFEEAGVLATFDRGKAFAEELYEQGHPFAWMTRIDSDDMYHPMAIQKVRNRHQQHLGSVFIRGYVWDIHKHTMMRISHPSPPLYTLKCEVKPWGFKRPGGFHGHNGMRKATKAMVIAKRLFVMTRHGRTNHVGAGAIAKGPMVERGSDEWNKVLRVYGLADPVAFWKERNAKKVLKVIQG
jgi:hypothetical protein